MIKKPLSALSFGDRTIMLKHVEEIKVDGPKIMLYMSSGRIIPIEYNSYDEAERFRNYLLKMMEKSGV